ncbi:uncharacterized protein LOC127866653 [Dreissena polymorpha]|uniref:uncharacterized protein LOC127866653 n=1 Tax=Dreissena polymorpha TaxID=45954 RepID=UPI002263D851|nr:uncharacterized protein LOC127866653 [Dreissena polymorpha]
MTSKSFNAALIVSVVTIVVSKFTNVECFPDSRISPICTEPDYFNTNFDNDIHESFLMLTPHEHVPTFDVENFKSIKRTHVYGNTTGCASSGSTCSWHYVINSDENRRPRDLIEAACNCKSRCQPVQYYVRVLRKIGCDLDSGRYIYRQVVEPVNVGCTCMLY